MTTAPPSAPTPQDLPPETRTSLESIKRHYADGRYDLAEAACAARLAKKPDDALALHYLALIRYRQGHVPQALQLMQESVTAAPSDASAQSDLGSILSVLGRLDEAVASLRKALGLNSADFQTHYNLGCTLQAQGEHIEAEKSYREATRLMPSSPVILCNLGGCLQELGRTDEAIACYRAALELDPDDIKSVNNLGVALYTGGDLQGAKATFESTLERCPDSARTWINLGMIHYDSGDYEKALEHYLKAIALDPQYPEGHFSVGVALQALCRPVEAIQHYEEAIAFDPGYIRAYDNVLMTSLFVPGVTPEALLREHRRFGEQFEAPIKPHWPQHKNVRDPGKRLKVGYVSGDFRSHAVAYFIEPVLANHDKSAFEVFCYSNNRKHDGITERLMAVSDHWLNCVSMSDKELAARIEKDGIDILIDLAGHSGQNRLTAFARKPAPVQITYLGYPCTTGLTAVDYRITDHYTEPEGSATFYTESLLRLPDSMWCYRPAADMPELTPLPALKNGFLTFGSFNNINKIGEECIRIWATLLHRVPGSRLLIATVPEGQMRLDLTEKFVHLGVSPERVGFLGKLAPQQFQLHLQTVDISLDPTPINGATTTCESLWLGVPVFATVGQRFLSRAGLSVLSAANMADFAFQSEEELYKTAALLNANLPLLANIRQGMREHLRNTALLDQVSFTRNLESLYRQAWAAWCSRA